MTFSLDQISLLSVYSAMALYALAFIAYAIDLSRRSAAAVATADVRSAAEARVGVSGASRQHDLPETEAIPYRHSPPLRVAVALMALAWLLHLAATILRGVAAERVPWANMYEFALTGTLIITAVYLLVLAVSKQDLSFLGTFISGLVLVLLGAATVKFYVGVVPLVPALQSVWLIIHVFVASTAVGLFALGFALSALQLIQARRAAAVSARMPGGLSPHSTLPSAKRLESLAYRMNIVGFVMWTFTLIAGAIWAEQSWGRYWGWDVKEVWTFIIWVVYAGYIHARATRGWSGTRSAWLSTIGFLAVIFNFTVVNLYFQGLHSYSGI